MGARAVFFIFSKSMNLQLSNAVSHVILKFLVTSVDWFEVRHQNDPIFVIFSAISSPACFSFLPSKPLERLETTRKPSETFQGDKVGLNIPWFVFKQNGFVSTSGNMEKLKMQSY